VLDPDGHCLELCTPPGRHRRNREAPVEPVIVTTAVHSKPQ
jgi:hypothetical protein